MKEVKDLDAKEIGEEVCIAMFAYLVSPHNPDNEMKNRWSQHKILTTDFALFVCGYMCCFKTLEYKDDAFAGDALDFAKQKLSELGVQLIA